MPVEAGICYTERCQEQKKSVGSLQARSWLLYAAEKHGVRIYFAYVLQPALKDVDFWHRAIPISRNLMKGVQTLHIS